jgi:hypothetical protein
MHRGRILTPEDRITLPDTKVLLQNLRASCNVNKVILGCITHQRHTNNMQFEV